MFITDHPELAAGIFAYDHANEDAADYAHSIASEYARHETVRLITDPEASSSTACSLIEALHGRATVLVCAELEDVLLYLTDEWQPGWEATFNPEAVESATRAGLLAPHQLPRCQTWITLLQKDGDAIFGGAHNPLLERATLEDARVLLALNVMALRAMGDHADEAYRGIQEISAGRIWETEALLAFDPLPGLPCLPFRDEEAAQWARWYRLPNL